MVISGDVDSWGRSCVFKLGKITVREVCGEELTSLGGRWEGGFRMGNTCTPMADSYQCMAKTTTVLSLASN